MSQLYLENHPGCGFNSLSEIVKTPCGADVTLNILELSMEDVLSIFYMQTSRIVEISDFCPSAKGDILFEFHFDNEDNIDARILLIIAKYSDQINSIVDIQNKGKLHQFNTNKFMGLVETWSIYNTESIQRVIKLLNIPLKK